MRTNTSTSTRAAAGVIIQPQIYVFINGIYMIINVEMRMTDLGL